MKRQDKRRDIRGISKKEILQTYKTYTQVYFPEVYEHIKNNSLFPQVYTWDKELFLSMGEEYMNKGHNCSNEVLNLYNSFIYELFVQFDFLINTYTISFEHSYIDPYTNYNEMKEDITLNNRLIVWNGGNGVAPMEQQKFANYNAKVVFRLVHDLLGHYVADQNFDKVGEENAYYMHKSFFSSNVVPVLAQEARAQQAAYYVIKPYNTFKEQFLNVVHSNYT